jgi:hypothetical protein
MEWCGGSRLAQVAQVTELQSELQEREGYEKAQREQLQLLDFKYNLLLDMVRQCRAHPLNTTACSRVIQTSGRFSVFSLALSEGDKPPVAVELPFEPGSTIGASFSSLASACLRCSRAARGVCGYVTSAGGA